METVLRACAIYGCLLVVFRVSGKRSLAELTTFDLLLLLIVSETTQQAMVGEDRSLTNAFLLIITWVSIDIGLSVLKEWSPLAEKWLEGTPVIMVDDGKPLMAKMTKYRIDKDDILTAARKIHGLEHMEQVKYAVLERSGGISIVPRK